MAIFFSLPTITTSFSSSSSSSLFLPFLSLLILASFADANGDNATTAVAITNPDTPPPLPPPPPPPPLPRRQNTSPFKPSIAVLVGLLTTVFSITFLLLLYAKHCKRRNGAAFYLHTHQQRFNGFGSYGYYGGGYRYGAAAGRKNSGIDRTVIESLPVFRFGALSGHKDGLECAVCLARFEPTEVLRLLPKCKHAFHVECVDTWLDAHSTCPLCRYRVDPEDILLIGDCNLWQENRFSHRKEDEPARPPVPKSTDNDVDSRRSGSESARPDPGSWFRRVTGRHSSAGEQASRHSESNAGDEPGRRSRDPTSSRRSVDGSAVKNREAATEECFDRPQRKDGLLIAEGATSDRRSLERRLEHRIIIDVGGREERWSDVRASDLLYLRSEMIMSDCGRRMEDGMTSGGEVIKGRSVSEITSVERARKWCSSGREINNNNRQHRQRQAAGVISRWLAWASAQSTTQSQSSQPDVRSHRSPSSTLV